jgi:PKD repeat protein
MRRACLLVLCCAALLPRAAVASRGKGNRLLRIVAPASPTQVPAHPFVNVIVRFGTEAGTPDPSTFKAKIANVNITSLFDPMLENGQLVGMRAAVGPALLIVTDGRHRANRLRLEIRGKVGKRRVHDIDRLRFAAIDVPDQAPVARALSSSDVILPNVPLQFDGTQSQDPEADQITYLWDFGDGTTSTDPRPVHVFGATTNDVTVRLTVDDGQRDGSDALTMLAVPALQPGRTPGILHVEGTSSLEFGGVALGASGTKTFTVRNTDATPTSELHVRLGTSTAGFTVAPDNVDLGPSGSTPITVQFAPPVAGHQASQVTLVASASNATILNLLSHGFGGAAPGWGPLPIADPIFYDSNSSSASSDESAILPNGAVVSIDDTVRSCTGGNGNGDYCLTDADCASNGGTCATMGTCVRGSNDGQPCSSAAQCPSGFCTATQTFGPIDICGDGEGGVIMLSDTGTYTDNTNEITELSQTLMRITLDGNGTRTGAAILARIADGTNEVTCDAIPASQGGQAYLAEYRALNNPNSCFRDAEEALVARRKTDGSPTTLMPRIDAAENLGVCEDYDPVTDLKVTPDGSAWFASLPNTGLWRIRGSGPPLLIVPNFDDFLAVHPDGSVVVTRSADVGSSGILSVYKISPELAAAGAPNLTDLNPCATFEVPNNNGRTLIDTTYAVDRVAPGATDGTILVSFAAFGAQQLMAAPLIVRGTVAFSSPGGSDQCTPIGIVNLELLDNVSF